MSVKTKELTVEVPEYLYEESVKLMSLGLFRDLSDLVTAGMRRELEEAKDLLEFEPEVIVCVKPRRLEITTNPARALWGSLRSSKDASQLKLEAYEEM